MEDEIKRWTAKRKAALMLEIIQSKTTVGQAARSFDLPPSEMEEWVAQAQHVMTQQNLLGHYTFFIKPANFCVFLCFKAA